MSYEINQVLGALGRPYSSEVMAEQKERILFDSEFKGSSRALALAESLAQQMLRSKEASWAFNIILIFVTNPDDGRRWMKQVCLKVKPNKILDRNHLWGQYDPADPACI